MKPLTSEVRTRGHYGDDAYIEKTIEAFGNWIEKRHRQIQRYAAEKGKSGDCNPLLARVYKLLEPAPYKRPTHDLLCECRRCTPSQRKFIMALKEGKPWC